MLESDSERDNRCYDCRAMTFQVIVGAVQLRHTHQAMSYWCCKGIDKHEKSCPFHPDYCNGCKTSACQCGAREAETLIAKCLAERRPPKNCAEAQSKLSVTRRLFRLLREGAIR